MHLHMLIVYKLKNGTRLTNPIMAALWGRAKHQGGHPITMHDIRVMEEPDLQSQYIIKASLNENGHEPYVWFQGEYDNHYGNPKRDRRGDAFAFDSANFINCKIIPDPTKWMQKKPTQDARDRPSFIRIGKDRQSEGAIDDLIADLERM